MVWILKGYGPIWGEKFQPKKKEMKSKIPNSVTKLKLTSEI